jgi:hypothetical protein
VVTLYGDFSNMLENMLENTTFMLQNLADGVRV